LLQRVRAAADAHARWLACTTAAAALAAACAFTLFAAFLAGWLPPSPFAGDIAFMIGLAAVCACGACWRYAVAIQPQSVTCRALLSAPNAQGEREQLFDIVPAAAAQAAPGEQRRARRSRWRGWLEWPPTPPRPPPPLPPPDAEAAREAAVAAAAEREWLRRVAAAASVAGAPAEHTPHNAGPPRSDGGA
jgi:hypothetical protein